MTARLITRLLAILGLPAALFMVGCALADAEDAANAGPFTLPACTTTADCAGDAICVDAYCVPPSVDAPERVAIELAPPDGSGYARTQLLAKPVAELGAEPLVLPTPTQYETEITDADGQAISANLAIFGSPRILGRELDVNTSFVAGGRTSFSLLEGEYVVRIRPSAAPLPGMEVSGFTVRALPNLTVKQFTFPSEYRRLYGEVTSSLSNAVKLSGVTVRAYGQKSGLPSTVSVTDEYGRYELLLPVSSDTTFRLLAQPPSVQQPAWGFEQVIGGIDASQGRERAIRLEPTSDDLRGTARIQILGTTLDGRLGAPVANAYVTLTATVTGVVEPPVYAVAGITDVDGVVVADFEGQTTSQVPLLRAKYVVRVVPPINTPYTSHQTVLDLTAAQAGFVLDEQVTLRQRTRVTGAVRSGLGRPVAGAFVDFQPIGAGNRPADAITEADGTFEAALDPGDYLVVVQPLGPTDAGEVVPVTAQRVEIPQQERLALPTVRAAHGREVRMRVEGAPDGAPVPDTWAELFVEVEGQVVSLGRAETDADGYFTAVVPRPNP